MRKLLLITLLIFISACSSQPIVQWKDTSSRQLENYKINFLTDKEDATEPHFAKTKKAISSSNDLNLLAVAYLTKYALHTAALEDFDDSDFIRIDKLQPNTANRAYYNFLKGNFAAIDSGKLQSNYSKILPLITNKDLPAAAREIASISDPLSQLIACGVWIKYVSVDESILQLAIDTAAKDGWRRPLWAYLNKLQSFYEDHKESAKAQNIKERLDLLKK
jgi:hypothetical protein